MDNISFFVLTATGLNAANVTKSEVVFMVPYKFFFLDNVNWPQPEQGVGGPTLMSLTGAGGLSFLILMILERLWS